ncbi:MAG: DedA family protein [Velocimicrobium sp.]
MSSFIDFMERFGLFAMFLCILLEYSCFPVSSEIVLPLSGAMASLQKIPFTLMVLLSVIAGLIGTSFCFWVGRLGGTRILNRISNRFPKTKKPLRASFQKFDKYGIWAVCIGRVIPICRTYIAFVAGVSNQSYSKFTIASLVGIFVWNTLLIGLGYFLRDNWPMVAQFYNQYKHILLLAIIFVLSLSLIQSIVTRK